MDVLQDEDKKRLIRVFSANAMQIVLCVVVLSFRIVEETSLNLYSLSGVTDVLFGNCRPLLFLGRGLVVKQKKRRKLTFC